MFWQRFWRVIFGDSKKVSSFKKGLQFETYAEKFFPASSFDLIHRTADYRTNRERFVESSLKPDFLFRDKITRKYFYLECKFRTSMVHREVVCCNSIRQLARYHFYHRQIPVFLFVGLGGRPDSPEYLFLVPLDRVIVPVLSPYLIKPFRINTKLTVSSHFLWNTRKLKFK